jgi:hypothetical protein
MTTNSRTRRWAIPLVGALSITAITLVNSASNAGAAPAPILVTANVEFEMNMAVSTNGCSTDNSTPGEPMIEITGDFTARPIPVRATYDHPNPRRGESVTQILDIDMTLETDGGLAVRKGGPDGVTGNPYVAVSTDDGDTWTTIGRCNGGYGQFKKIFSSDVALELLLSTTRCDRKGTDLELSGDARPNQEIPVLVRFQSKAEEPTKGKGKNFRESEPNWDGALSSVVTVRDNQPRVIKGGVTGVSGNPVIEVRVSRNNGMSPNFPTADWIGRCSDLR